MSSVPYSHAESLLAIIRSVMGIPPPSVGPVQQAAFSIQNPAQIARAKAVMDGKKPVPFSGLPGYSERGAPDEWNTAMGEVFGYRWWYLPVPPSLVGYLNYPDKRIADVTSVLHGANNQPWKDGRMEARCTSYKYHTVMARAGITHEPPETREACGCGFWAYFNRDLDITSVLPASMAKEIPNIVSYGATIPVFGVVKGSGRVIIGEKGFRSQYAEIRGLCIPPVSVKQLSWWIPQVASHFYNLPVQKDKCSQGELATRLSDMETMLAYRYPSARLFTEQDLLTSYFPPDKNYA